MASQFYGNFALPYQTGKQRGGGVKEKSKTHEVL